MADPVACLLEARVSDPDEAFFEEIERHMDTPEGNRAKWWAVLQTKPATGKWNDVRNLLFNTQGHLSGTLYAAPLCPKCGLRVG